jgi:hypothetical protein
VLLTTILDKHENTLLKTEVLCPQDSLECPLLNVQIKPSEVASMDFLTFSLLACDFCLATNGFSVVRMGGNQGEPTHSHHIDQSENAYWFKSTAVQSGVHGIV